MKLLFAADMSFNYIKKLPSREEIREMMREPAELFAAADFSMVNLENVFGDRDVYAPIVKDGPNLISDEGFAEYVRALHPTAVGIANNHTMDYGAGPMYGTRALLEREGYLCVGAGKNLDDAYRPATFEKDGVRIAVIPTCENEFGGATENVPGTAAYSLEHLTREIERARADGAHPIVYFHTGHEGYPFPSPRRRELCRHLVDIGAAAVICMHTHCPQGYEIWRDAPIVYSMGNFYFPHFPKMTPAWHHGYMTELEIGEGGVALTLHPYRFDMKVELLRGEEREAFDRYMAYITEPISSGARLSELFDSWCLVPSRFGYYEELSSFATDLIADGHRSRTPKMKNIFVCEAHNELLTNLMRVIFEERVEEARAGVPLIETLQRMELPE